MIKENYYTKKKVYGDNPLREIIYELEDALEYDSFRELEYIPKGKLQDIILRHDNTVKEFITDQLLETIDNEGI